MRKALTILSSLAIIACNNNKEVNNDTTTLRREDLIGEWNNISLHVDIHSSKNKADSNDILNVERAEWETKLKIKPIRTYFRTDSTWNSAHYNLNDSLVYNPTGKWWLLNDSLVMRQDFPSPDTTAYALRLVKDTATFEALLDWDMDGKKDDRYIGRQIKVNRQ